MVRWVWRSTWVASTFTWALLFYQNYWQAVIPAFGDVSAHLATLRLVLVKYCAVGVLLGGAVVYDWLVSKNGNKRKPKATSRLQAGLSQ